MTADPLWYKDAIIYELHVKTFCDGNGDGIGDFPGLTRKLDYLQRLGVTCLWLLPFYESPLRSSAPTATTRSWSSPTWHARPRPPSSEFPSPMNGFYLMDAVDRSMLPPIGSTPYGFTLAPQECRWFQPVASPAVEPIMGGEAVRAAR